MGTVPSGNRIRKACRCDEWWYGPGKLCYFADYYSLFPFFTYHGGIGFAVSFLKCALFGCYEFQKFKILIFFLNRLHLLWVNRAQHCISALSQFYP